MPAISGGFNRCPCRNGRARGSPIRACWLATALAASASAGELRLPPAAGEFSGDFTLTAVPGAPVLHWKLRMGMKGETADRAAVLAVEGEGMQARGRLELGADGNRRWQIDEAAFDLARWFAPLARAFGDPLAQATAEGAVTASGTGEIRDGKPAGSGQIDLRDGSLRAAGGEWSVTGVTLRGALGRLPSLESDGPVVAAFREASAAGLTAREGEMEFTVDSRRTVHVTRARCRLMDGIVETAPFDILLERPEAEVKFQFTGLDLAQVASLLPPVLADARGRLSGEMTLNWSAAAGFTAGRGRLIVSPVERASLRLSLNPGFLSSHAPKKLTLLPRWLGPIARLFSPPNPVYDALSDVESGRVRLEVQTLEADFQPTGDPAGRSARVVVAARSQNTDVIESIRFEINVAGPLTDVIRFGLSGNLNVRAR